MKSLLYSRETPIGTFWIRPESAGRVQLGIDRVLLRTYSSAKAAARAVADRETGWQTWDEARDVLAPFGLENWERGAGHQKTLRLTRQKASARGPADYDRPSNA
ncbi:MAG: hypothetical protein ACJ74Z_02375 [Bryobacteraceae bacterium]